MCRNQGYYGSPAEIHHLLTGKGIGHKNSDDLTIPLCYHHHRGEHGIHTLGKRRWEEKYGLELDLLDCVNRGIRS